MRRPFDRREVGHDGLNREPVMAITRTTDNIRKKRADQTGFVVLPRRWE